MAAFGGHLFYDLFLQGWGGGHGPLGTPPGSATDTVFCKTDTCSRTERSTICDFIELNKAVFEMNLFQVESLPEGCIVVILDSAQQIHDSLHKVFLHSSAQLSSVVGFKPKYFRIAITNPSTTLNLTLMSSSIWKSTNRNKYEVKSRKICIKVNRVKIMFVRI